MNKHSYKVRLLKLGALALLTAAPQILLAQNPERIPVPLTDPSRPVMLKVSLLYGGITVKGADVKEVTVETRAGSSNEEHRDDRRGGLRRLNVPSTSLSIEEENNNVRVSAGMRAVELLITVPRRTSMELRATNDGDIKVDGVEGEIDVNNLNGAVSLTNISGSVVGHALNEDMLVKFNRVSPDKPMSFSSLNGDIDLTFPADLKATFSLSTGGQGDVYTDFEAQLQAGGAQPIVEDSRGKGGKYKVKLDKVIRYTVNGGGPEIKITNFNGDIIIRKAGGSQ